MAEAAAPANTKHWTSILIVRPSECDDDNDEGKSWSRTMAKLTWPWIIYGQSFDSGLVTDRHNRGPESWTFTVVNHVSSSGVECWGQVHGTVGGSGAAG